MNPDHVQAITARTVAAYRAGEGRLFLGGRPEAYHGTCSCCSEQIRTEDCYDIGSRWFHARCLAPHLDAAPAGNVDFLSLKLRVDIDGLVQRGDAEVATRIEAAVKAALKDLQVMGAPTLTPYVRRVAVQHGDDLSSLRAAV